jgi:hypothetical protein
MEAMDEIVRTAVIGTERSPAPLPSLPGDVGAALAQLQGREPERALLSAAAILSTYRLAGHVPAAAGASLPPPCPPEELRPCSAQSSQHLATLLSPDERPLLPEWLAACAAAGKVAPPRHLPGLLDLAATRAELRPLVAPVIGNRGRWLAAQNPAWQFAAAVPVASADDPAAWDTGTRDQRVAYLRRQRETDPAAARQLLEQAWPQETPEDRAAFLATFQTRLTGDDEPFLEQALDDRRKEVRRVATDLLARLPGSQFSQRMLDRLRPAIRIELKERGKVAKLVRGGGGRKVLIEVTPPKECDKAMTRDGIDAKPPAGLRVGEKAWWVQQLLAAVPPTVWTDASGATPEELVAAARDSDWDAPLLSGWTHAAARYADAAWSAALLRAHLESKKGRAASPELWEAVKAIVQSTPAPQLEQITIESLQSTSARLGEHPAMMILHEHKRVWGRDLSLAVLDRVRADLSSTRGQSWDVIQWVGQDLGSRLSPDVAADAARLPDGTEGYASAMDKMRTTVQFRHDMLKEIRS